MHCLIKCLIILPLFSKLLISKSDVVLKSDTAFNILCKLNTGKIIHLSLIHILRRVIVVQPPDPMFTQAMFILRDD